jgi:hypothetical protein
MMGNTYVHYGSSKFQNEKFKSIKNELYFTKPSGGLWASPIDAKFGWKDWNECSSFAECSEENCFQFRLDADAKVLDIYSEKDLDGLPVKGLDGLPALDGLHSFLDFEELLRQGYDAIELHLSQEKPVNTFGLHGLRYRLYGWDCDSILVMNPDVIEPTLEK